MWWWHTGWSWWGWAGMTLSMIVFWGLVIWGVIVLVRYLSVQSNDGTKSQAPHQTPEDVLANRFARGDIDEGDFERRLEVLRSSSGRRN